MSVCPHRGEEQRKVVGRACGVRGVYLGVYWCNKWEAECMPIHGGYAMKCCKTCEYGPYGNIVRESNGVTQ